MFALTVNKLRRSRHRAVVAIDDSEDRFVLPRPLRRARALLRQLGDGPHLYSGPYRHRVRYRLPGCDRVSMACRSAATRQTVAQATTAAAGFAIEDVKVSGNERDVGNRHSAASRSRRDDFAGGARCRCSPAEDRKACPGWKTSRSARSIPTRHRGQAQGKGRLRHLAARIRAVADRKGRQDHCAVARQQVRLAAAFRRARCRDGGGFRR